MKTELEPEALERLIPQAIGWLTKLERAKQAMTPAKRKAFQAKLDAAVAAKLAEPS